MSTVAFPGESLLAGPPAERDAAQPDWVRGLREGGRARFAERGLPTTRWEAWRYTNVAPIAAAGFRPAGPGDATVPAGALTPLGVEAFPGPQVVFVNGRHAAELSARPLPEGLEVLSLRDALAREAGGLEPFLGRIAADGTSPFADLNTAHLEAGALIRVRPGAVVSEPLLVVFLSTAGADRRPLASHPRTLLVAGRNSQLTLLESYGGPAGDVYLVNAVTEIVLEDGAVVDRYKLQQDSEQAYHVSTLAVRQGRASRFSDHAVCLGGALARNDIETRFDGEGGECSLNGLFIARGGQHMDTHSRIDHAQPHCTSRELYKGVLDGRSRGVFHGCIVVRKGAQKTDAHQTNKNLLLSREALVNSTPALEIFADDVRCKHGSTTGQLDPLALFYLRSRGIGAEAARSLLTYAFASDLVGRIRIPQLRAALEEFLHRRLPSAPEEEIA